MSSRLSELSSSSTTKKFSSIDELRASRRRYVTEARENGFEDGLRTLLADLYPDNAHFIYELLQNAEDAGATAVDFNLERDRLIVSHDGERRFLLDDIAAITGIGQSGKKDDPTQIGKFGVGFKAVFAYTDHPEVRSGQYSFVIKDLFVPDEVASYPQGDKTVFEFPFDRPEKEPSVAYGEVAQGLRELGDSSVLFLTRIATISYSLADGGSGRVSRDDAEYPRIAITRIADDEATNTSWLRVVGRPRAIEGPFTVAAAFRLQDAPGKVDKSKAPARLRVQPLDAGETCIYFPATKEASGLRFHIHAPFASTVARDSVRNTPENVELVRAIGELIVDALPKLRDEGLLDDGLLSALPNADDPLEAPYDIVRDLIYKAFQEQPLTPVFGGGGEFAPANELVSSPQEFRSGFDQADLPMMLALRGHAGNDAPRWVAPRAGKAGQFLRGLDVELFGWSELTEALDNLETEFADVDSDDEIGSEGGGLLPTWQAWLASRSDEQLREFYVMLGHGVLEAELPYTFNVPMIRVANEASVDHVAAKGIYLPADRDDREPDRVPQALAFFDDDEPSKALSALAAFYKWLGIHRWDDKAVVKQRLAAYASDFPEFTQHLRDLRLFMQYVETHPKDLAQFTSVALFVGDGVDGKAYWTRANRLVIDTPYETTGLATLHPDKYRLAERYKGKIAGISEFARTLGAVSTLQVESARIWDNKQLDPTWRWRRETGYGTRQDWDLREFDGIVDSEDPALLRSLWDLACREPSSKAYASYQANGSSQIHRFASQVAQRMSSAAWILDRFGELRTPESMTTQDLPDGWPPPGPHALAVAVGFGAEARSHDIEQVARRERAESLGISLEFVEEVATLDEADKQEVVEFIRQMKERPSFPSAVSADPERRAAIAGQDASVAPEHRTEMRERSVATGVLAETKDLADQYLREQYTDDAGVMFCQGCHQAAEFKVNDQWYFEKVQFLPRRKHLHHQNFLALCPLCAVKYKYVRHPDDEGLLANLTDLVIAAGSGTVTLPIALNGKRVELKFTGKHAVDLKAVLSAAGEARAGS